MQAEIETHERLEQEAEVRARRTRMAARCSRPVLFRLQAKLRKLVNLIGNIVHESVPFSNDEDSGNVTVAKWGECKKTGANRTRASA